MANSTLDQTQLSVDDLRKDVDEVVLDPDRWLRTPNDQLGGREPIDLLNSGQEADQQKVRDLIEAIKHGFFS